MLVTFFMFLFYKDANIKLVKTEIDNIALTANQQRETINAAIKSHATNLGSMAKTIVILGDNETALVEYLRNLEKNLDIDNVIYIDYDGIATLSSLKKVNMNNNAAFQTALHGEINVTAPFKSRFTGQQVIEVAAPILKNDEIIGVVMVEYSIDFITKTLTTLVDEADEKGYTIILDGSGNVITSTSYQDEYLTSYKYATFENNVSYEEIVNSITARKPDGNGTIAYINGEKRILEYRPIDIRDWSIIVVSEDVSDTLIRNISDGIQYLLIAILASFFIFLTVIIYLRRKGIKEIETVAFYDELTGLPNLVSFREQVKDLISTYPTMHFAMQKIDIKNFKAINEMFGHDIGNLVLTKLSETIKTVKEPTFIAARVGADEFLMFAGNGYLAQDDHARAEYEQHFRSLIPELAEHEFRFRYGRYFLEEGEDNVMEEFEQKYLE